MKRIFKIKEALGLNKRGLDISQSFDETEPQRADALVEHARNLASQDPGAPYSAVLRELAAHVEGDPNKLSDVRREIFRDAVKGIANVIRNGQLPAELPLAKMVPGGYGSPELLAQEIERANATKPLSLGELRSIRGKIKAATEGGDAIDEVVKRLYYARLFHDTPSTENILPPGSPSRSLDLTALIVERIFPNGWWTLGTNGENISEPSAAKVGTWTGDEPKAETASTAPLALLSALILTMIEAAKKEGGS